jgi:hypothetical protein
MWVRTDASNLFPVVCCSSRDKQSEGTIQESNIVNQWGYFKIDDVAVEEKHEAS